MNKHHYNSVLLVVFCITLSVLAYLNLEWGWAFLLLLCGSSNNN